VGAAAAEYRDAAGAEAATFESTRQQDGLTDGDELNDAAKRVRAVQVAAAAAIDLDAIDCRLRDLVPEHPSAKRVVERHPVREHERTARRGAADAAQRHALRGRFAFLERSGRNSVNPGTRLQRIVDRHRGAGQQIAR
jgi:hypothetical protein